MEEQRKQVGMRQLYNQVPQMAWVSSSWSWSQLGDKMPAWESACRLRACGPQWPTVEQSQLRWGRNAAMVRRTLGQYVAVYSRLQLTSHTQPTSTLSRIKCERNIFIKKCVCSFIEVRHYCWLCFRIYLYMYVAIQHYQLLCWQRLRQANSILFKGVRLHPKRYDSMTVSEFDLQLHYYIHFQTNTLGKGINPFIP